MHRSAVSRTSLHGSDTVAVKEPVITVRDGRWEMWLCEHPLTEAGHEDRMSTSYLTSDDGLAWERHGTVLEPTPGSWDARGARVTTVLSNDPLVVLYDGRRTAEDNWHEVTGVARSEDGLILTPDHAPALASPHSDGALRYVAVVPLPEGGSRWYAEVARPDGAHDLVTVLAP